MHDENIKQNLIIRNTEEVGKLYTKKGYLKRIGIKVDLSNVIDTNYVIKGNYKRALKNVKNFDYVIVSHVLEHMLNIISFFTDIQNILNKDGQIILYLDKRIFFKGDVYYWPFSNYGFLKFLRDCKMYNMFSFSLIKFLSTQLNSQEFLVVLSIKNVKGFDFFDKGIADAMESYGVNYYQLSNFPNKIEKLSNLNTQLSKHIEKLEIDKSILSKRQEKLNLKTIEQQKGLNEKNLNIKSLHEGIVEITRIKNMLKSIVIKVFKYFRNFFLNKKYKLYFKFYYEV